MLTNKAPIRRFFLVAVLCCNFSFVELACAQSTSEMNLRNVSVDASTVKWKSVYAALESLAVTNNVPIGFEARLDIDTHDTRNVQQMNGHYVSPKPLETILDDVVQIEPGYAWEIRDGVVNVFPVEQRDYRVDDILNTQVKEFELDKVIGAMGVGAKICEATEVKEKLKLMGLTPIHFFQNGDREYGPLQTSFVSSKEGRVKDILNELLKQNGFTFWMTSTWGPDHGVFTIVVW